MHCTVELHGEEKSDEGLGGGLGGVEMYVNLGKQGGLGTGLVKQGDQRDEFRSRLGSHLFLELINRCLHFSTLSIQFFYFLLSLTEHLCNIRLHLSDSGGRSNMRRKPTIDRPCQQADGMSM